jgi:hypothetical protein
MSVFSETSCVEQMILDVTTHLDGRPPHAVREVSMRYAGDSIRGDLHPVSWTYVPHAEIPRQSGDVMVEAWVREA